MSSGKPIIYWDTCVLLAWIKDETRPGNEMAGVNDIAEKIHRNHVILITSVITDIEILQSTLDDFAKKRLMDFFRRPNCQKVDVDPRITALSSKIRDYYQQQKGNDGLPTLRVPDTIHLATAIDYEANSFHTFDAIDEARKRRALIPLSGNVAGYPLVVCKPPTPDQASIQLVYEQDMRETSEHD